VIRSGVETVSWRQVCCGPCDMRHCSTKVRPYTLKSAAVRAFGSWSAALAAAGLEPANYIRRRVVPLIPKTSAILFDRGSTSQLLERWDRNGLLRRLGGDYE